MELFLCQCEQIPATAWQQLETGAGWEKLKKVSVSECFGGDCKGTEGAAALLKVLDMDECSQIPATAWRQLEGAKWKKLTDMRLQRCFRRDAQGTDGMAELFTALARCPELKQERGEKGRRGPLRSVEQHQAWLRGRTAEKACIRRLLIDLKP
eukprot:s8_g52.t1